MESVSATTVVDAPADAVFAVLADPAKHAAVDGTGWVCAPVDGRPLTEAGQIFRMAMYHERHPDGDYQTANEILVCDPPRTICWRTGYDAGGGELRFGGWTWRYDLAPVEPDRTSVTLTYDWSATSEAVRALIGFPPFGPDHLDNSLSHLAGLVTS